MLNLQGTHCIKAFQRETPTQLSDFELTGIDLACPFFLKNRQKVCACLYTRAIYLAGHLEVTFALKLSASSFVGRELYCLLILPPSQLYSMKKRVKA